MKTQTPIAEPKNHWIKWEGCEREYMTRADAIDTIRACAAVNVRQVIIGNIVEQVGNLENDTFFSNVKEIILKDGLSDAQKKIALETLVPEMHSEANSLWDNRDMEMTSSSLEIKQAISLWAEWRKGFGNRCRIVFCVQSSEVDDAVFESHDMRAAMMEAAIRLERRRVSECFAQNTTTTGKE